MKTKLTNAISNVDADYSYSYQYDDIGNRVSSAECGVRSAEYVANELNQYTNITSQTSQTPQTTLPEFDDDGNQTLIRTATGEWRVTYNGENRPVLWTCLSATDTIVTNGDTIAMSYDRLGRRVTKNAERFVYDGYLQIANHRSAPTTSNYNSFIWDPTEPVATRPLTWNSTTLNSQSTTPQTSTFFYTHDGNKNVSEVIAHDGVHAAHYEYAPFGGVISQRGDSAPANPWRFSGEFADDELDCDYYNYRPYEPVAGRWLARDPLEEDHSCSLYVFVENSVPNFTDERGLSTGEMCGSGIGDSNTILFENRGVVQEPNAVSIRAGNGYAAGKVDVGGLDIHACCKCIPQKKGGPQYKLLVQVKSWYKIRVVRKGAKWFGGRIRSKKGYDRTMRHERLHVENFKKTFADISRSIGGGGVLYSRTECESERKKFLHNKKPGLVSKWSEVQSSESTHSGSAWDAWRKTDGKTESDEELW